MGRTFLVLALMAGGAILVWLLRGPTTAIESAQPALEAPAAMQELSDLSARAVAPADEPPLPTEAWAPPPQTREEIHANIAASEARKREQSDARLEVVLLNLPEAARARTIVRAFQETEPGSGEFKAWLEDQAQLVEDQYLATLSVISGRGVTLSISGPGLNFWPLKEALVLSPSEIRRIEVDLDSECLLRVRIKGLPDEVRPAVTLRYLRADLGAKQLGLKPTSQLAASMDAEGWATLLPPERGDVSLHLTIVGEPRFAQVPLRSVATGATMWNPCLERELEVEPVEPLLAIAPTDSQGRILAELAFSVVLARDVGTVPEPKRGGLLLLRSRAFEAASVVRFLTKEFGILDFTPADGAPLREGIVGFDVTGAGRQGSLRVHVRGPLPSDWAARLFVLGVDGRETALMIGNFATQLGSGEVAREVEYELEVLEDGYSFRRLPPGTYRFHWQAPYIDISAGEDVEVLAGRESSLRVEVPQVRNVRGRILEWELIPEQYRPLFLLFGGQPAQVTAGLFEARVAFPLEEEAMFRTASRFVWSARGCMQWAEAENELLVRYPFELLCTATLRVPPLHGGTVKATQYVASVFGGLLTLQPSASGELLLVQVRGVASDALVYEYGDGSNTLRGWLRLSGQDERIDLPMPGRALSLSFDRAKTMVRVHAEGPVVAGASLPSVELTTLDTSVPGVVWVPTEASALLVDSPFGRARFPLDGNETSLRVTLPK